MMSKHLPLNQDLEPSYTECSSLFLRTFDETFGSLDESKRYGHSNEIRWPVLSFTLLYSFLFSTDLWNQYIKIDFFQVVARFTVQIVLGLGEEIDGKGFVNEKEISSD